LFGRGVRLKGKNLSLKREEENADYHIKVLQNISIIGLNASYVHRFLNEIQKEVPDMTEFTLEIKLNREEKWNGKIITFRKEKDKEFKNEIIELDYSSKVARRVTLDLRSKITVASGFTSMAAEYQDTYSENFLKRFNDFLDYNTLELEINRYKILKGYQNLILKRSTLEKLINKGDFILYSQNGQFGIEEAISGQIQDIAVVLIKDYINKYYADREKDFFSKNLSYEAIEPAVYENMFPKHHQQILKIPEKHIKIIEELKDKVTELFHQDDTTLPSIHFDKHLYSPIIAWDKGKKFKEVKVIPTRLNEGETKFLKHFKEYIKTTDKFANKEIFVLRNLSKRGLGFFMESSSFYPDFIIWVVDGLKQHIYFLDPKGILIGETNFNNPKVLWCKESIPELEYQIQNDSSAKDSPVHISLSAFILSVTSFQKACDVWSPGKVKKEEFTRNHILFIEENREYLDHIFSPAARAEN